MCLQRAALIHKPDILFLDEPTIGLDPVVKENIRKKFQDANYSSGNIILFTSDVGQRFDLALKHAEKAKKSKYTININYFFNIICARRYNLNF